MNRSRTSAPTLKHLAFFEALADTVEETPGGRAATAGLLALRLVDHWVLAGSVIVEPESVSVRSVRQAIMTIAANDPQREVLLGVVNTIQTLREVDVQPVLPRLFAYAGLLEKRGALALAADVYATVVRLAEEAYDGDLLMDCFMRLGYCERMLGHLREAETSYSAAGKVAKRLNAPARVLHSRIGVAKVVWARGNLPKAEELLAEVVAESERSGYTQVQGMALHDHSAVVALRGNLPRAVCLAYDALRITEAPAERDFILTDIGAYFVLLGRFDVARDALLVQEATAPTDERRWYARINLLSVAARQADEHMFRYYLEQLATADLPPQLNLNFAIERARGLRAFGKGAEATKLLHEAREVAGRCELARSVFEIDELLAQEAQPVLQAQSGGTRAYSPDPAAHVVQELRTMAAAVAG